MSQAAQPTPAVNLQIISIVTVTFVSFLCIGLPLAVLPRYVLNDLGYSAVITGIVIGTQYFSTLLSRPMSGSLADRAGPKQAVLYGLMGCIVSGLLTLLSTSLQSMPTLSLGLLLGGRVVLGVAQGLVGTGSISWAIGRFGSDYTAKVISFNGIASYGGIAIGAPLGVAMVSAVGLWSIGALTMLLSAVALAFAWPKQPAPILSGSRMPFARVFLSIAPHGTVLALGSIGFGTLATFITLYYDSLGWVNAEYCLTAFGIAFIVSRLLFAGVIKRFGGYPVAVVCLAIEFFGLMLLAFGNAPSVMLAGAALTGLGLSLVYPALGVEAIALIPAASRSSALGAYALFFDLSLGLAGPLMGYVAAHANYSTTFLVAALLAATGTLACIYRVYRARY
ncbi:MFS transporter [Pseudomonas marincola]|uniref:MFS transporter n=1 Tax=Pseudomonas marincola TaxID=437900 RepID=UPI0008E5C22C|nr:MFS transporter [Pseudomonas marincola]SFT91547.1 Predicted arabinose efflux permease, MFS family [Pseudomonas marincola]